MRPALEFCLYWILRAILWFRYRLKVKGLEQLTKDSLTKTGGILFLPNHPAVLIDPLAVVLAIWSKFRVRPLIVEYMYYTPVAYTIMKFIKAIPIPSFTTASNSLKRKKANKVIESVVTGLKQKENFVVYPAGKVKRTAHEFIGGASGVHQILEAAPEANVVLVRIKGLWGSSFSAYSTGSAPNLREPILHGLKCCLKNLLFFTPRREISVEFVPAPADFPYQASRLELNRYLENWYNQPDGLLPHTAEYPGDSVSLVSYSMWGEKYLQQQKSVKEVCNALPEVAPEIKEKVINKLCELTQKPKETFTANLHLAADLGLDSLDMAEISAFLQEEFEVKGLPVNALTTVASIYTFAAHQQTVAPEESKQLNLSAWKAPTSKCKLQMAKGTTIPEVFLNNSQTYSRSIACGDARTGILTYKQLRLRVLLLAEAFKHLPGQYIGVLLPASVAANVTILALSMAGKTPLMINWTVGPRHLESVLAFSKTQAVISSWAFLDKLDNVQLDGLENILVMLEDIGRELSYVKKFKAFCRTKLSTRRLLKLFKVHTLKAEDDAVLLFTSGTENQPKGVPLSHKNILCEVQAICTAVDIYSHDILFGILPPFHSFGFTVSTLLPLLTGLKLASYPDPTDGFQLAKGVEKWGASIVCGAPTFLKAMAKAATPDQLASLRLCITGAEKAPPELFQAFEHIGKRETLLEGYGITECSPVLTVNRPHLPARGVGLPLPGIELCIVHPDTYEKLPIGSQGLILACGANIFRGYLHSSLQTPFVSYGGKQWYITGDLGFLDQDGYLTLSGRQKRFVKIGGEMISLSSIEEALLQELATRNLAQDIEGPPLAVSAKEDGANKAKIQLFSCFHISTEEVNLLLKKAGFSSLVRISSTIQLAKIPLMGSGKINYRALENIDKNN